MCMRLILCLCMKQFYILFGSVIIIILIRLNAQSKAVQRFFPCVIHDINNVMNVPVL